MTKLVRHAARVLQTLRYLRARQLFYQVRARLPRRFCTEPSRPVGPARGLSFRAFVGRSESYLGGGRFQFLNRTSDLGEEIDWAANDLPVLWRYNLHYFDYLQQRSLDRETGEQLIEQWIAANPPATRTVAWQPYPTSLRIVNWIKFLSRGGEASPRIVQSLALQTENLARQIEYHLLGNHLFANAKALWFAGVLLQQNDWVSLGRRIALDQLHEQFLPDGGHFELSPMYHAVALEDLLDLINLTGAASDYAALAQLRDVAAKALGWLAGILHPNGTLPLLNDSANGIAPPFPLIAEYAERLNVSAQDAAMVHEFEHGWIGHNYSGYWVLTNGVFRLLFDTALLGPDYLPGHAHCDMLSVLLDFHGQPVFTDTGVFEYAESQRRSYSRSTAAHNTVQVDGLEQAEMWGSFRVARRGRPQNLRAMSSSISCEHHGYGSRNGPAHRREIRLLESGLQIVDRVSSKRDYRFSARYHCAPDARVGVIGKHGYLIDDVLLVEIANAKHELATSEYYPEFGQVQKRPSLHLSGTVSHKQDLGIHCTVDLASRKR